MSASRLRQPFPLSRSLVLAALASFAVVAAAHAAPNLTIEPLTWNVVGLDSNDVTAGPNQFPIGARVCNTGDAAATNVTSSFLWSPAGVDPYLNLRPGTLSSHVGANAVPSLAAGDCRDFYYEVEVTRDAGAYDYTRNYTITATADTLGAVSTPSPRELYVEHLVSQSRNTVFDIKLDGVSIPAGGTMALVVGETYTIELVAATATNGYEQLETFVNFPNTIFKTLSVESLYTADTSPFVPNPNDKLYGDACSWENDPNSPNYRACLGVGKVGGGINVTYEVEILQIPGPPLVNPEPLSSLIYDFSGSSYHYNADYSTSARFAAVVDPTTLTLSKGFNPDPTNAGGVSVLTFTISNPNLAPIGGVNFTDTFPTSPGAMVVANPTGATTSGCGTPTFAPIAGAGSISFSDGTVAASGTCTINVNVTVPVTGTYTNTTSNLFVGTTDTGNAATATLTANATPPAPPPVCGQPLALWNFPTPVNVSAPAPAPLPDTTVAASAAPGAGLAPIESAQDHTVVPAGTVSWGSDGSFTPGAFDTANNEYFEFAIDTTGVSAVDLSFWARRTNNGPRQMLVYFGTSASPPGTLHTTLGNPPTTEFPSAQNTWESSGTLSFVSGLNGSGLTYFRIFGAQSNNDVPGSDLYLDDVLFTGCKSPLPPTLSKSFSPSPVAVGASSTLSFTVTNPNPTLPMTGIAFTDVLPAGLTVTTGSNAQCGGTLSRTAPDTLSFTGGSLAAGASCLITATVTATTAGPHQNVSGFVSSTEGGTNTEPSGIAAASLTAVLPPAIDKQFSPNPVVAGGVSTLTFVIINPNQDEPLSGVAFSDTFPLAPSAMVVAPTPAATTSGCGAPTYAPSAGDPGVSFTNGTLAGGGICVVTVDVTASVAGSYPNTTSLVSHVINAATVNGNSASDTLVMSAPNPNIALLKLVGPTAAGPWSPFLGLPAGDNVFYRFVVENTGDVPLANVTVSDPPLLPDPSCTWPDPLPVASPTADPTAECVLGPISALAGTHPNTATASGEYGAETPMDGSTATYGTTELTLAKSASPGTYTAAGEVISYSFLVTNTGDAPLAGPVTIDDDRATDESCPAVTTVGDGDTFLDPGESITCTATYTITAADVTAMSVTNLATATADGVDSNTDSETVVLLAPGLSLTKDGVLDMSVVPPGGVANVGDEIDYTLTATNTGNTTLTGVSISDPLLPSLSCIPAQPATLAPAATLVCTGTYVLTQADIDAGSRTNTATADSDQTEPTSTPDDEPIPQVASLVLTKTGTLNDAVVAPAGVADPGDTITYGFAVTNTGNVTVTNIAVTDPLLPGLVCTIASLGPGITTSCSASNNVYTLTSGDITAGVRLNTATAVGSGPSGDVSDSDDESVPLAAAPVVDAVKSSSFSPVNDLDGSGDLSPGDTLEYTLVITNSGPVAAQAVVLTDTPDPNTDLVVGTVVTSQGTVVSGNGAGDTTVTVDLGDLPATNGQATITFLVSIQSPFPPDVDTVYNQGTVSGDNFTPVLTDDPATPSDDDPTTDVVGVQTPIAIPTLSEWGAVVLAMLLAWAAWRRLRITSGPVA